MRNGEESRKKGVEVATPGSRGVPVKQRGTGRQQSGTEVGERETEYDGLTPGLFARSKWRSAVILKFNRVVGGADRIKKSEWKLVSHDNSPAGSRERELLLSTDSVSPCQHYHHPTTLLSSASISPPLPRPSVSSSFSFHRFSVSFSSRGAHHRASQLFSPNLSLRLYNRTSEGGGGGPQI